MKNENKVKVSSLLKLFAPFMGKKQPLLYLSLVLSGVSAALHILPFVFVWLLVREIMSHPGQIQVAALGRYAWAAFGAEALAAIIYYAALMCSHLAAFRVEVGMQKVGMKQIIHMPLGFFDLNASGRMRKIVNDGAGTTHTFLAHQLPDLAGMLISPVCLAIIIFAVDWRLGLAMLVPVLFGTIWSSVMMGKGVAFQQRYYDALEEMSSEAVEYVRGIPVVKTFGQSVFSFKHFVDSINRYKDMVYAYTLSWQKPMTFFTVAMHASAFFLIPAALIMIGHGENLGLALTNFIFYLMIAPVFAMLTMKSMYMTQNKLVAGQAIDRLDQLIDYPALPSRNQGSIPKSNDITFHQVSFTYPGAERAAIRDISFEVKEGETVALVGASGGGKTTISRLAARFWDVDSGQVTIGGVDVREIPKDVLMDKISFVFQNTRLFKESLRDNILYGSQNASRQDIDRAVDLSQSREIIDGLPLGLDTVIGSKGTYLSGGEQQRIALARAILKNAPIVLLDEATAFADPENEHLIQKALKALSHNKTTLMIAHRLTSITDADRILVIEDGGIAESGTHQQLLQKQGIYKRMWEDYLTSLDWQIASTTGEVNQ